VEPAGAGRVNIHGTMARTDYPGRLDRLTDRETTSMRTGVTILAGVLAMTLTIGPTPSVWADDPPDPGLEQTPPRLSLTDGRVSFWRPGAEDWVGAQVNTPLAPGDMLSTGSPGTLEVQIGARAFVRAWANTQLGLANQDPDFIQFTLVAGSAVLDLRTLEPGDTVEVDTPNAAVTIRQAGYYRVDTTGERSRVMTREGGRATVTPASGQAVTITPSEELVIEGTTSPQLAAYAAPPLDDWDRWNYTRTDRLLDAVSARYVSSGTYGLSDLDPHGSWRVVPTYGTVWVPTGMPAGWAPYSAGSWIVDPMYGWTWVDAAPWGWAPYHHGRWCFVDGYWAWAPGPVIARPVYAPALVAFFGDPGGVVVGPGPAVGWVALGWGEPVVPWWGHRGAIHGPSWRGWGGPRVVNNVIVSNTTVVSVQNITVYRNAIVPRAVVAVDRARFGRGPITHARAVQVDGQRLKPLAGAPQISATPASFAPTLVHGVRPPEGILKRSVIATRPARREAEAAPVSAGTGASRAVFTPPQRLVVTRPEPQEPIHLTPRPPFGRGGPGTVERPMGDRKALPAPPRPGVTSAGPAPQRPAGVANPAGLQLTPGPGRMPVRREPPSLPAESPATLRPRPSVGQAGNAPGGALPAIPPSTGAVPAVARPINAPSEPLKGQVASPPAARRAPAMSGTPGRAEPTSGLRSRGNGSPTAAGYSDGRPNRMATRPEISRPPAHPLPGEPANRLAPGRGQRSPAPPGQPKG
jgi:hypothetical protein